MRGGVGWGGMRGGERVRFARWWSGGSGRRGGGVGGHVPASEELRLCRLDWGAGARLAQREGGVGHWGLIEAAIKTA